MSGQSLVVILLVGLLAGWLAGVIVAGGGFGFIADIAIGIVGAFIGNWLFAHFHVHMGTGLVGLILRATIGAVILLGILRIISGYGYGYRRY